MLVASFDWLILLAYLKSMHHQMIWLQIYPRQFLPGWDADAEHVAPCPLIDHQEIRLIEFMRYEFRTEFNLPGVRMMIAVTISEHIVAITRNAMQIPFQFRSSSAAATKSYTRDENKKTGNGMTFKIGFIIINRYNWSILDLAAKMYA